MASITPDPNSTRPPAFSERVVFATYGGRMYARKWPRPAGPSPLPYQQETVQRFIDANKLAKISAPEQIIEAMKATKKTGLYPRDLLTKAMLTGLFDIVLPNGQIISRAPLTYEVPVFLGFRVYRSAALSLTAGVFTAISWDTAELNAIGLWNPATPTFITVPDGVTVMSFTALASTAAAGSYSLAASIGLPGGANRRARFLASLSGGRRFTLSTGPVAVSAGQQWQLHLQNNTTIALEVGPEVLSFSGQILG